MVTMTLKDHISGLFWYWRLIAQDNLQPAGLDHLTDNLGTFAMQVQLHFMVLMETLCAFDGSR